MKPIKDTTPRLAGLFLGLLVVSLLTVACSGRAGLPAVEGPALIMFYTDN
jgi:hypothetical protein